MTTDWGSDLIIDPKRLAGLPVETLELSGDVTAFSVERALRETRERQDPIYWLDLDVLSDWILVGDNGQGDEWWLGPRGGVFFFDHQFGERSWHGFEQMHLTVTEWLMVGHLLGRFEARFVNAQTIPQIEVDRLEAALEAISPELPTRWPYDLGYGLN